MVIIFVVLSLLGWIYLTQASHVATTSRHNQNLEEELARLRRRNMELAVEIAQYESVERLARRASELGYVRVTPEQADSIAIHLPAPELSAETAETAANSMRQSPTFGSQRAQDVQIESSWAQNALGGVRAQFIAWVQAEAK
jgi:hypothetical protein